jgi:hypothetical protein
MHSVYPNSTSEQLNKSGIEFGEGRIYPVTRIGGHCLNVVISYHLFSQGRLDGLSINDDERLSKVGGSKRGIEPFHATCVYRSPSSHFVLHLFFKHDLRDCDAEHNSELCKHL